MSTEPILQPGTFGSVRETTTIYSYKSRNYILCLETLFCVVLTIIAIVPDSVMMVSKFVAIAPDIVATFSDPHIRIPFIIIGPIITVYGLYFCVVRAPIKFVLTRDGIFYSNIIYCIYSPWESVLGIENIKIGIATFKGLRLNKEFQHELTIEMGIKQGLPVFEYKKPIYAKRYSSKKAHQISSVFFWTDIFPLLGMSNKKRIKKKLIVAIRLYAPQVLQRQTNEL